MVDVPSAGITLTGSVVPGLLVHKPIECPFDPLPATKLTFAYPVLFKGSDGSLNPATTIDVGAPGITVVSTELAETVIVKALVGSPLTPDGVTAIRTT